MTVTVVVEGETKTFTAEASTTGSPLRAASQLLTATHCDAEAWLRNKRNPYSRRSAAN